MAEVKWFGAPLVLVIASWFVDYTVLAVAVLLCATLWLLLHMAGVTLHGSVWFERGPRPAMGRLHATVTLLRRDSPADSPALGYESAAHGYESAVHGYESPVHG